MDVTEPVVCAALRARNGREDPGSGEPSSSRSMDVESFCARAPHDTLANAGIRGPNHVSRVPERGSEKISA